MHPATINAVSGTIQLIRQALINIEQIMASDPGVHSQTLKRIEEHIPDDSMCLNTEQERALAAWVEKQIQETKSSSEQVSEE